MSGVNINMTVGHDVTLNNSVQ